MFKYTWHIVLMAVAGWINHQQQDVIEYLMEENRVLREKLGPGRLRLDLSQKRRLAKAAAKVGRKLLQDVAVLFSPDSLLKWHRTLVAQKYGVPGKRGPQESQCDP